MTKPPLTLPEILDYFDAINCITDVQMIADYLNEYGHCYPRDVCIELVEQIKMYAELFTA